MAASPRRPTSSRPCPRAASPSSSTGPRQAMAVANVVAPEHLELLLDGAEALLPLVRRAGAVFLGPYAPASVGDYVAGPNHVLPTARTARFALGTAGRRLPHARPRRLPRRRHAWRASARTWPPSPRPKGCPRTRRRCACAGWASRRTRNERVVTGRAVPLRADLRELEGYHSPQVEVEVRLNTNESPLAPPEAWLAELRDEIGRVDFNRYPDRHATALRARPGRLPRGGARRGLLRQRLQRGPPVPAARLRRARGAPRRCSSPPTRCTATSPR